VNHERITWADLPALLGVSLLLSGCGYLRLLRPGLLKQLNPTWSGWWTPCQPWTNRTSRPGRPSWPAEGSLPPRGGRDGVFRDAVTVPENQFIRRPAIIPMPRGGELEIDFRNADTARTRTGPGRRG
jgi:hypothetical protein